MAKPSLLPSANITIFTYAHLLAPINSKMNFVVAFPYVKIVLRGVGDLITGVDQRANHTKSSASIVAHVAVLMRISFRIY